MTRAALYVRVSTREQTMANQERELRRWADRLGLQVLTCYSDTASGARSGRSALTEVLTGGHRREFDTLLIWSLDRLTREGIGATARYLDQLRRGGVRVMSYQEPWLDTGGPVGDLLVAIFAWIARQERERLGERVRAGLARARAQGVRFGRPARDLDLEDVRRRRAAGQAWRTIARALKIPSRTLRRRAKAGQNPQAESAPGSRYLPSLPERQIVGAQSESYGNGTRQAGPVSTQSRTPGSRT